MSGIPLWYGEANLVYHPLDLFEPGVRKATHIAFTVAEAEALLVVAEKAREFLAGIDEGRIDTLALRNAVEALDA